MARSYFAFARAGSPSRFQWHDCGDGRLLSINELWSQSENIAGAALLFRMRSDSDKMIPLVKDPGTTVESCIGLYDSTTRWRLAADFVRATLSSIRNKELSNVCWQALNVLTSKHQAAVTVPERQHLAGLIRDQMAALDKDPNISATYETEVAATMVNLIFSENEYEATAALPNLRMFMINATKETANVRHMSVMTLMSSFLLVQSFARLSERLPEWLYAPMPVLGAATGSAPEAPESTGGGSEGSEEEQQ